jgi:hypothetical protein
MYFFFISRLTQDPNFFKENFLIYGREQIFASKSQDHGHKK